MFRPKIKVRTHLICWTLFIAYEILSIGLAVKYFGSPESYVLHYALNIGLFYFHAEVAMPLIERLKRRLFILWPFIVAAEIACYILLLTAIDFLLDKAGRTPKIEQITLDLNIYFAGLWRGIYFMLFATGYYFLKKYLASRLIKSQMALDLQAAKLAYLKAQINPHLLFNTLNFVYSNTYKTEPATGKATILLSKIMRYAVDSGYNPLTTAFAEEILQVEHFIELLQLQKNQSLNISFTYDEEAKSINFIPLVLLTLTENMFKHGNLAIETQPGSISVRVEDGNFTIKTSNVLNTGINQSDSSKGLKNIRQRLEIQYGRHAIFLYGKDSTSFNTEITIPLHYMHAGLPLC